jgi:hypothetical protein
MGVKLVFKLWGVFAQDHGMDIKSEWHACSAEFLDPVQWIPPSGEPDFVHAFAE